MSSRQQRGRRFQNGFAMSAGKERALRQYPQPAQRQNQYRRSPLLRDDRVQTYAPEKRSEFRNGPSPPASNFARTDYQSSSRHADYSSSSRPSDFPARSMHSDYPPRSANLDYPPRSAQLNYQSRSTHLDYPSKSAQLDYPSRSAQLDYPSSSNRTDYYDTRRTEYSEPRVSSNVDRLGSQPHVFQRLSRPEAPQPLLSLPLRNNEPVRHYNDDYQSISRERPSSNGSSNNNQWMGESNSGQSGDLLSTVASVLTAQQQKPPGYSYLKDGWLDDILKPKTASQSTFQQETQSSRYGTLTNETEQLERRMLEIQRELDNLEKDDTMSADLIAAADGYHGRPGGVQSLLTLELPCREDILQKLKLEEDVQKLEQRQAELLRFEEELLERRRRLEVDNPSSSLRRERGRSRSRSGDGRRRSRSRSRSGRLSGGRRRTRSPPPESRTRLAERMNKAAALRRVCGDESSGSRSSRMRSPPSFPRRAVRRKSSGAFEVSISPDGASLEPKRIRDERRFGSQGSRRSDPDDVARKFRERWSKVDASGVSSAVIEISDDEEERLPQDDAAANALVAGEFDAVLLQLFRSADRSFFSEVELKQLDERIELLGLLVPDGDVEATEAKLAEKPKASSGDTINKTIVKPKHEHEELLQHSQKVLEETRRALRRFRDLNKVERKVGKGEAIGGDCWVAGMLKRWETKMEERIKKASPVPVATETKEKEPDPISDTEVDVKDHVSHKEVPISDAEESMSDEEVTSVTMEDGSDEPVTISFH